MIPRFIHRVWVGGLMPEELQRYGETWRRHHPEWQMFLWSEESLWWLKNAVLFMQAEQIAPSNVGQFQADLARYEILHKFGGVYIDADFECLKPIDELLDGIGAFAAWEQQDVWVNNAIMGSVPGHPFFARCIADLPMSVKRNAAKRPNVMSGPQFLTKLYREDPQGLTVFDQKLFYPYSWSELHRDGEEFPDAFCVHHWNNRRTARGVARTHI